MVLSIMWEEEVGLVSLRWSTLRRRGTGFVWRWRDVMLLTRFRTVILHVRQTIQLFIKAVSQSRTISGPRKPGREEKEFLNLR